MPGRSSAARSMYLSHAGVGGSVLVRSFACHRETTIRHHFSSWKRAKDTIFCECGPVAAIGKYSPLANNCRCCRRHVRPSLIKYSSIEDRANSRPDVVRVHGRAFPQRYIEAVLAQRKIHGLAIIGIHQPQVPQLGALIEIRNTRTSRSLAPDPTRSVLRSRE